MLFLQMCVTQPESNQSLAKFAEFATIILKITNCSHCGCFSSVNDLRRLDKLCLRLQASTVRCPNITHLEYLFWMPMIQHQRTTHENTQLPLASKPHQISWCVLPARFQKLKQSNWHRGQQEMQCGQSGRVMKHSRTTNGGCKEPQVTVEHSGQPLACPVQRVHARSQKSSSRDCWRCFSGPGKRSTSGSERVSRARPFTPACCAAPITRIGAGSLRRDALWSCGARITSITVIQRPRTEYRRLARSP